MTVYSAAIDSDSEIIRVDNNLTEVGGQAINQLRDAVFSIEKTLGINPQGSLSSVSDRLNISINQNGTIKASALTSVGLATLPIVDNQVASNAGIKETKLALNYSTSNLHTLILSNSALTTSLASFTAATNADLLSHIKGSVTLSDGSTPGRHVASQIDINQTPSDTRDPLFTWTGLVDKNGIPRTATNVTKALSQINDDLVDHENTAVNAHPATSITVDTDNFTEIPVGANTVQKAFAAIDNSDRLQIGDHRATMHANGVPKHTRSEQLTVDGYSQNIVPPTSVRAFLVNPPATTPLDDNAQGDDIIKFLPINTGFAFDSQFAQVKVGDIVTINYDGYGVVASFPVESIRFTPGSDWTIRINGVNLFNTDGYSSARIDRPAFDENTYGVLAVASANNNINSAIMGSVIVGSPRGATALGLGFDANQIDSTHYLLYLQLYPSGNPQDKIISLPGIDVTGNAGITPGQYTLESVVASINDSFRTAGFNYRFIAFAHNGELGVMLADSVGGASFSIVNGVISGASLSIGIFINNVIGDATNSFDALGFGVNKANLASPPYVASYASTTAAASFPTKIIVPLRRRSFAANGVRRDTFAPTFMSVGDGYWAANLTARTVVGPTVEVTYEVPIDLAPAGLAPGKTLVVQPTVGFSDSLYLDADYGRFVIKTISFVEPCGPVTGKTTITVVNGVHASGNPIGVSSAPVLPVKIYFSEDSVGFNAANVIDAIAPVTTYNRFHEIYITGDGNTFSHERARMPHQAEGSASLATTARWTVKNVSPKLRGFIDVGSALFNRYVRFYVLRYDVTSGEYDGYIGWRDSGAGTAITNYGNITTSRKNVPAKFYDETNIDYIELEFFDDTASAGANIMSTNTARFVDIEIFPTLETDDEFMLLATCELDNTIVKSVVDRREFGNTSEVDFTESAMEFITAGDRYLHENGVIRGLDYVGLNPVDSHLLKFEGGLALVNGNVVAVNSGSVSIPEIRLTGASLPATVTWAICINESGLYEPIILTTTKQQYFATKGAGNYYVPSVTFTELITRRKDLTIIAGVIATINSITLSAFDARRFVDNVGMANDFVLTSDNEQFSGSFKSVTALSSWITNSNYSSYVVKVRGGDITPNGIDLLAFTDFGGKKVTFDGTNFARSSAATATFVFNASITFAPNITFKNIDLKFGTGAAPIFSSSTIIDGGSVTGVNKSMTISANSTVQKCVINMGTINSALILNGDNCVIDTNIFGYNPSVDSAGAPIAYTASNYVNADTSAGCIFSFGSRQNITINNNAFSTSIIGTQRPPHISFVIFQPNELNQIKITKNKFIDGTSTARMSGIAIVNANTSGVIGGSITDSVIEDNIGNREQNIILTTASSGLNILAPGLHSVNTFIRRNVCGNIGHVVSAFDPSFSSTNYRAEALTIEDNTCRYIANLNSKGTYQVSNDVLSLGKITHDTGDIIIRNNSANWIHASSISIAVFGTHKTGTLLLDGNKLNAYDDAYLTTFGAVLSGVPINVALTINSNLSFGNDDGNTECRMVNNTTSSGFWNNIGYGYLQCFNSNVSLIANSNTFSGIIDDSAPTTLSATSSILGIIRGLRNLISNNRFERQSNKIFAYVYVPTSLSAGEIVDNVFDQVSVDNDPTHLNLVNVSLANRNMIVERNKNQTGTITLNPSNGNFVTGIDNLLGFTGFLAGDSAFRYTTSNFAVENTVIYPEAILLDYVGAIGVRAFQWLVSLEDLLPSGVDVIKVSLKAFATANTNITSTLTLKAGTMNSLSTAATPIEFIAPYIPNTVLTTEKDISGLGFRTGTGLNIVYVVLGSIHSATDTSIITAVSSTNFSGGGAVVTYRW